jgi:predicted membrane chloride channel (bestrophin family)
MNPSMTFFASFLILGFLEIGQEIENPFSYEENDLGMSQLPEIFKTDKTQIWMDSVWQSSGNCMKSPQ